MPTVQSFSYLAYLGGTYIIEIVHRFAAIARFKGIHDMIGASAKKFAKDTERQLECRCTKAIEYFRFLRDNMSSPSVDFTSETMMHTSKKPLFAATRYIWLYAAYNDQEAQSKEVRGDASIVLNKCKKIWEVEKYCKNVTQGSLTHYEYRSLPEADNDGKNLAMRKLHCMCTDCYKEYFFVKRVSLHWHNSQK